MQTKQRFIKLKTDCITIITVAHVIRENVYWASEIEWLVVGPSRDKKIREYFERVRLCALRVARRV
jgi:hypothetical protein